MCKCADVRMVEETDFLQTDGCADEGDVQMCRYKNVQMAKTYSFAHLHIKSSAHLFTISVDDVQYHLVLLQLGQIIKQNIMFFRIRG